MPDGENKNGQGGSQDGGQNQTQETKEWTPPTREEVETMKKALAAANQEAKERREKLEAIDREAKEKADKEALARGEHERLLKEREAELSTLRETAKKYQERDQKRLDSLLAKLDEKDRSLIPAEIPLAARLDLAEAIVERLTGQKPGGGPSAAFGGGRGASIKPVSQMTKDEYEAYKRSLMNEAAQKGA